MPVGLLDLRRLDPFVSSSLREHLPSSSVECFSYRNRPSLVPFQSARALALSPSFPSLAITRKDYFEYGPDALRARFARAKEAPIVAVPAARVAFRALAPASVVPTAGAATFETAGGAVAPKAAPSRGAGGVSAKGSARSGGGGSKPSASAGASASTSTSSESKPAAAPRKRKDKAPGPGRGWRLGKGKTGQPGPRRPKKVVKVEAGEMMPLVTEGAEEVKGEDEMEE